MCTAWMAVALGRGLAVLVRYQKLRGMIPLHYPHEIGICELNRTALPCCRGSHQHNPVYPYIFDRAIAQQMALSAGSRVIKARGCWAQKSTCAHACDNISAINSAWQDSSKEKRKEQRSLSKLDRRKSGGPQTSQTRQASSHGRSRHGHLRSLARLFAKAWPGPHRRITIRHPLANSAYKVTHTELECQSRLQNRSGQMGGCKST